MKMFKKAMALTLAVLMLLTSMSVMVFAAEEQSPIYIKDSNSTDRATFWLLPYSSDGKTLVKTETATTTYTTQDETPDYGWSRINGCSNLKAGLTVPDSDLPSGVTYYAVNNSLKTTDTYSLNNMAIWYKVKKSQVKNKTSNLWKVEVHRFATSDSPAVDITYKVIDKNKVNHDGVIPAIATPDVGETASDMYEIGVFEFANGEDTEQIRLGVVGTGFSGNFNIGGVRITPVVEETKWLYPLETAGSTTATANIIQNNDSTAATYAEGRNYTVYNNSDTATSTTTISGRLQVDAVKIDDAPSDYKYFVQQSLSSSYTKKTGIEYKPELDDTENPYYAVYVHRVAHGNRNDQDYNIVIRDDDGYIRKTIPAVEPASTTTWASDMYHVGNVKLSDPDVNTIGFFLPLDKEYSSDTKDYFTVGAVKLVHLDGVPNEDVLVGSRWMLPYTTNGSSSVKFDTEATAAVSEVGYSRPMHNGGISGLFSVDGTYNDLAVVADGLLPRQYKEKHYVATVSTDKIGTATTTTGRNGIVEKDMGYIYKPLLDDTDNPYWTVYYEKVAEGDGNDLDNLHIRVTADDGSYYYNIDNTASEKSVELIEIGTFKFSSTSNRIDVFVPAGEYAGTNKVIRIGGVKLVRATEADAQPTEFLSPKYTELLKGDTMPENWKTSDPDDVEEENRKVFLSTGASNINIKPGSNSLTIDYAENAASNEALSFNNGIMDMSIWWRNAVDDEYFSITFDKGASGKSELRISNDGVKLIDNDIETADFKPFTDYTKNSPAAMTTFETTDEMMTAKKHKKDLRLEICDAPGNSGQKVFKLIIANRTSNAVPLAMGIIPADSPLIAEDDDVSDNEIVFTHTSTAEYGADFGAIAISKPDIAVTEEKFNLKAEEPLTAIDGGAAAKVVASYPFARTAKIQNNNPSQTVSVILALYDNDGNICADYPVSVDTVVVRKGYKVEYDYANTSASAKTAKLFVWNSLQSGYCTPYADMFDSIPVNN